MTNLEVHHNEFRGRGGHAAPNVREYLEKPAPSRLPRELLCPLVRPTPAVVNPPREKGAVWVAPKLVAQIAYQEWTADERLRQPVYLGLRDDKKASEVLLPGGK